MEVVEEVQQRRISGGPEENWQTNGTNKDIKDDFSKIPAEKRQSTRNLSKRLSRHGHKMCHMTVQNYLVKNLGAKAFKRWKIPKLTEKHVKRRLKFCKDRRKWTPDDWKKVIWSNENYQLYPKGNSKNDVIWAKSPEGVETIELMKFSPKVMVWGAMTSTCLSELHIVPQKTSIDAVYYQENILEKNLLPMMSRTATTGDLTERKCPRKKSELVFMQDGARCHTAATTTQWLQDNEIQFWGKDEWPPNSPDLNPIENLWSILQESMQKEKSPPKDVDGLTKLLKKSWRNIPLETLENLVNSMPHRVKAVIEAKGHYVIK